MNNKKSTTAPAPSGDESAPKFEIVPAKPDGNPATDVSLTPTAGGRLLTRAEFRGLAEVPAEVEWFQNLDNPRTRDAYKIDVGEFMRFIGIATPKEFRDVTRSHVLAWRKSLEVRALQPATIRRKLSALASLFDYLCEKNAIATNHPPRRRTLSIFLGASQGYRASLSQIKSAPQPARRAR